MSLVQHFIDYIRKNDLFTPGDKLLLAVSGGVDSVVLCELCRQAGYEFSIAHCNFQLRGDDSERDETFVRGLAEKYKVAFYAVKFDTTRIAKEKKLSVQEAARELRYNWFGEIRASGGYNYILTAHHADDNIETLLMKFFRGTGIKGLKGMDPRQGHIARPLLFARRKELEEFLETNRLSFVPDCSNEKDDYTRNYFRHQVIPLIERSFPEVTENMIANISRFREAEQLYRQAIDLHKKKLLETKGSEVHIPVLKLLKTTPLSTMVYEIIREYGFSSRQTAEVLALLKSESGKYVRSASHRIIRNRQWLIIAPGKTEEAETVLIESIEENVQCSMFNVQCSIIPAGNRQPATGNNTALLDAAEIKFPLLLRKWKQGDYFYPLGMQKKKKLARFFIDQKLSKTDKEKIWVIETDKKIIWVIGHRIDNRFKVTEKTRSILKIVTTNVQTV